MATLRHIPKSQFARSLWKNGLGYTDQIAIEPKDSDLRKGNYLWRISSAAIENASDFSIFPDHDRALVVLSGAGLHLAHRDVENDYEDAIDLPPLEAYEFPGDIQSSCRLIDGPVKDLSVFFKKGVISAAIDIVTLDGETPWLWTPEAHWNFVFAARGNFEVASSADSTETLLSGDAFLAEVRNAETETYPIVPHEAGAVLITVQLWNERDR